MRFAPKADGQQQNRAEREDLLKALGQMNVATTFTLVPELSLVKLPDGLSVDEAIALLGAREGILGAQPNYFHTPASLLPDDDPMFPQQWGLDNRGQVIGEGESWAWSGTPGCDIDAPEAWDMRTSAGNVVVAVIDSGIAYGHPDLSDNMWLNPAEVAGNGLDDDGNGFVDDVYGYDFCTWAQVEDSDPMDELWHGTHVAGTDTGYTWPCVVGHVRFA